MRHIFLYIGFLLDCKTFGTFPLKKKIQNTKDKPKRKLCFNL